MMDRHRNQRVEYRYYCSSCVESGEWYPDQKAAERAGREHRKSVHGYRNGDGYTIQARPAPRNSSTFSGP